MTQGLAIPVPVPPRLGMAIDWTVGTLLAVPGAWLMFYGASTLYTLDCSSITAQSCSLDSGTGLGLLPLGTIMVVAGAIELYNAESKYDLRSVAAQMVASESVETNESSPPTIQTKNSTGTRPCPYCGYLSQGEFVFCQICGRQIPPITT